VWKFIFSHPIPGAGLFVGSLFTVLGYMIDGYHLNKLGFPPQILEALGALIFFLSTSGVLYKWWAEREGGKSVATLYEPHHERKRTSQNTPSEEDAFAPDPEVQIEIGDAIDLFLHQKNKYGHRYVRCWSAFRELRQLAFDGKITLYGNAIITLTDGSKKHSDVQERIDKEYWLDHGFVEAACLLGSITDAFTFPEANSSKKVYVDVRMYQYELDKIFSNQ
jgi:hypothetical protein